jgi:hypothetical protein
MILSRDVPAPWPADDDVIEDVAAQLFRRVQDLLCHVDIGARWRGVTRRVVVQDTEPLTNKLIPHEKLRWSHKLGLAFGVRIK